MRKGIVVLGFIFFTFVAFAQKHSSEAWLEGVIEKGIGESLAIEFVTEARFKQTGPSLKSISEELGLSYSIIKPVSVGLTYKITQKNRPQGFFPSHTLSTTLGLKQKYGAFKVSYRNKFECSREMYISKELDLRPTYEDRNCIKIQYGRKKAKILPAFSIETFHPIAYNKTYSISEVRYGGGFNFDLKRKFELSLGYTYKVVYKKRTTQNTSIFSLSVVKNI